MKFESQTNEEFLQAMDAKIEASGSTALKGIPGSESDSQVCQDSPSLEPADLQVKATEPQIGDDSSVFTNLAMLEPVGPAGRVGESSNTNLEMATESARFALRVATPTTMSVVGSPQLVIQSSANIGQVK